MSELTSEYERQVIARFQFDRPAATPSQDAPPFDDRFEALMESAQDHHECPEKRVKGWCSCVLND